MKHEVFLSGVYDNYEVFYAMTLAAALISPGGSERSDPDTHKLLTFMGEAFGLEEIFLKACREHILGEMTQIAVPTDYHALSSVEELLPEAREMLDLYEIKGRALEEVIRTEGLCCAFQEIRISQPIRSNMRYEAFLHPYHPRRHFADMKKQALWGNVVSTRQLALLYCLGIGCRQDREQAKKELMKCVLWGDGIAAMLLAHLLAPEQAEEAQQYRKVACALLWGEGVAEQDDDRQSQWFLTYTMIIMIRDFVINPNRMSEMDLGFLEVMLDQNISEEQKYNHILYYKEMGWRREWGKPRKPLEIGYRSGRSEGNEV